MAEQKEGKQIAIDIKRVIPIFADNVLVANLIRTKKEKKGGKEGHVTLIFIDTLTQQSVARVVVSKQTAEALQKALEESLKKFDKEMKSKDKSDEKKVKIETTSVNKYLG